MYPMSRRSFLVAGPALGVASAMPSMVRAAPEFKLKFANIMPADHPLNVRMTEACARILEQTNGRVEIRVFPASQLGTDADMLSQLRSGALELFAQSGLIAATFVPAASITGVGFAFSDYPQVWKALDGELGQYVVRAFTKANLIALDRAWDNGFRQITSLKQPIKSADDLKGFKIRVPPSPLWTSLFKSLGASPTSIPWGETYSALQTRVADGLENPIAGIYYAKMYEVQKFISMTNHMWDGFWVLGNRRILEAIPSSDRDIIYKNINDAALLQRADVEKLNVDLQADLAKKGITFVDADPLSFRKKLQESGFYTEWRGRYGADAWNLLESVSGKLS